MTTPKISIITVVRNGAAFIERCLQSVALQDYDNMEYIVLDGASTDGTQAIIERYRKHIAHYASRPDGGPYEAQKEGIALASGDIIGFLMADDWLSPDAARELAALYAAQPDADLLCFGMQEYKQLAGQEMQKTRLFRDPPGACFGLLDGLYCQGLNRFYSRRILKGQVFARNDQYPQLADRDFYLRLGRLGLRKAWTDKLLYHMLVHAGSNSTGGGSAKISRFLEETAQIAQDHLQDAQLAPKDRALLTRWYCFNKIRSVFFLLRSGRVMQAMQMALAVLWRYPLATLKSLVFWRMPKEYRPVPS